MFRGASRLALALLLWSLADAATGETEKVRPGVWLGRDLSAVPLPVSGYQVYLIGEFHGVEEMAGLLAAYLAKLHAEAGLRDVALEEDAVYEPAAQDYVAGRSDALPEALCLRTGMLQAIRSFNAGRKPGDLVRVHLADIDSPPAAIRRHLTAIQGRITGAASIPIPEAADIGKHGLAAVEGLRRLAGSARLLGELRTVEHSIRAYQHGFEVETGPLKGSPYLDDREEAIAANIRDLLRERDCPAVLALYGSDHVSKRSRKDGGPDRNRAFSPMALRLEESGLKVFSVVAFPLSGRSHWRGPETELMWTARDGWLADRETLDRVLAAEPEATLIYVDPKRERIRLPSQDISEYEVDAFLALAHGTAMAYHCALPTGP